MSDENKEEWEVRSDGCSSVWLCEKNGKVICEGLSGNAAALIMNVIADAHNASLSGEKEPLSDDVKAVLQNTLFVLSQARAQVQALEIALQVAAPVTPKSESIAEIVVKALAAAINLRTALMTTNYDATTWNKAEAMADDLRSLLGEAVSVLASVSSPAGSSTKEEESGIKDA